VTTTVDPLMLTMIRTPYDVGKSALSLSR